MAEQLALDQSLGERGAVQAKEGARRPRALSMDSLRDDLLARPRLAGDEDRRLRDRHAPGHGEELDHRAIGEDEAIAPRGPLDVDLSRLRVAQVLRASRVLGQAP